MHEPDRLEGVDEVPQVFFRYSLPPRDILQKNRALAVVQGQIDHQPHSVSAFRGEFHLSDTFSHNVYRYCGD
jgi:hypothetical protein